jgi:hypothetical protein
MIVQLLAELTLEMWSNLNANAIKRELQCLEMNYIYWDTVRKIQLPFPAALSSMSFWEVLLFTNWYVDCCSSAG